MSIVNDVLSNLLLLIVAVLTVIIPKYVVPILQNYIRENHIEEFVSFVTMLVEAAEQLFTEPKSGSLKRVDVKKKASEWLQGKNWSDDLKEECYGILNTALESAVFNLPVIGELNVEVSEEEAAD